VPVLLTTYGLLLVFALFSFAQWKNAEAFLFTDQLAQNRFFRFREDATLVISENALSRYRKDPARKVKPDQSDDIGGEKGKETPDSLEDHEEDKTNNARRSTMLNIYPLLCEDISLLDGKGKSCFALFKSLLQVLYEGEVFFDNLKKDIPDLEERFISTCIDIARRRKEDEKPLSSASQLLILDLSGEPQLEEARFGMMRGEKRRGKKTPPARDLDHYMLQEFITINKSQQHIMSIWLAPHPLLLAAFGDEAVVEEIMRTRHEMYKELRNDRRNNQANDQKTTLSSLKQADLQNRYKDLLVSGISAEYIDFGVSLTNPKRPPSDNSEEDPFE
jgi:hypothetical protein